MKQSNDKKQAPKLWHTGEKFNEYLLNSGKAIRPHGLERAFNVLIDSHSFAQYKLIMYLTGNADGFVLISDVICRSCGISERGYRNARASLVDRGWITFIPYKSITVNYDVILNEYIDYLDSAGIDPDEEIAEKEIADDDIVLPWMNNDRK